MLVPQPQTPMVPSEAESIEKAAETLLDEMTQKEKEVTQMEAEVIPKTVQVTEKKVEVTQKEKEVTEKKVEVTQKEVDSADEPIDGEGLSDTEKGEPKSTMSGEPKTTETTENAIQNLKDAMLDDGTQSDHDYQDSLESGSTIELQSPPKRRRASASSSPIPITLNAAVGRGPFGHIGPSWAAIEQLGLDEDPRAGQEPQGGHQGDQGARRRHR